MQEENQKNNTNISGSTEEVSVNQQEVNKHLSSIGYKNPKDDSTPKPTPVMRQRPTVRTYRDFAVKALKDEPTSLAKMIIKEKRKEEVNYKYSPKNKKNIFMIVLSVVLVFLGIAAIAAILILTVFKKDDVEIKNLPLAPKSVIYFDYKSENSLSGADRSDIVKITSNGIENTNIPIGDIKIFYFTEKNSNGFKTLATTKNFFDVIDTRAPAQFIRNLEDESTFGVISSADGTLPFYILKLKDFDSSYDATLAWERTLILDLGDFFKVNKKYYAQKFSDLSLYNKDARVILDEEGKVIFGYSFVDLHTLVFFTTNTSFKKIITELQNNRERI